MKMGDKQQILPGHLYGSRRLEFTLEPRFEGLIYNNIILSSLDIGIITFFSWETLFFFSKIRLKKVRHF